MVPNTTLLPPLWLDAPDAAAEIDASKQPRWIKTGARELSSAGLTVLRGMHAADRCERVVADYERYVRDNARYVSQNLDALGHEKRLVNFQETSPAAMEIGVDAKMMSFLDFVFGYETSVYTSLTFKYGTQQPVHRDTPHFATWPRRYFVGCWTALRDVNPDSGPLFYHRGGHRPQLGPEAFWREARERLPKAARTEQLALALDLYNGEVIRNAPQWGDITIPELRQGDVVVWHADTPHGGSTARNVELARWSIVFHCAPMVIQVHQHDAFFGHTGPTPPPQRYGFRTIAGRAVAGTGGTAYM